MTAFEASIEEACLSKEDEEPPDINHTMITEALEAVSVDIFPHRALENQKLWMRRSIRKPKDMSFRKMASALTRMNAKLIRFPGADEDDLFSTGELLEILEWSLPSKWRAKFDLASYIPSMFDRPCLIAECEALERSELLANPASASKNNKKSNKPKSKKANGN